MGSTSKRHGVRGLLVASMACLTGGGFLRAQDLREPARAPETPAPETRAPETPAPAGTTFAEAEETLPEVEKKPDFFDALLEALIDGDVEFNLRIRAEVVEQEDTDTAQAYTERLRLGYGTKPLHGVAAYFEFEDTRSADEDLYNAAGLNGQGDKAVVADPENTELNQFFVRYAGEHFGATAGRQRLTLDDKRFIGNVGWRQNEQTLDAYTITSSWIPGTSILYSYVDDVNRIFGPDANRDLRSDSHLVNASFAGVPGVELTAFGYFLDFGDRDPSSSNSFGLRLTGSRSFSEDYSLSYAASYAHQVDSSNNPNDYESDYYFVEGSLDKKGLGRIAVGYEVLGSDDGNFAFQTPLATLHQFNGWADLFTTTPDDGLEDLYFLVGADLPMGIESLVVYHMFFSEDRSRDLGGELDALLGKAFNDHVSVLAKLAVFHSESQVPKTQKFWLQTEIKF